MQMSLKIAVYAIAKNEELTAQRWLDSTAGADGVFVLDTGSSDQTVEILRNGGATVAIKSITPWRFDLARNHALNLVPKDFDICISLDLDEVLCADWRQAIEKFWNPDCTLLRYPFVADWDDKHNAKNIIWGHKVHCRQTYHWQYAVHEILRPHPNTLHMHKEIFCNELRIEHHPVKQKSNTDYYTQLKYWSEQEPTEPRYKTYLLKNLFDMGEYQQCLQALEEYFNYPDNLVWASEKAFLYRIQAWCHEHLNHLLDLQIESLLKAVAYAPQEREPWCHLAESMIKCGNFPNAYSAAINAIRITNRQNSYRIQPEVWNGKAEQLLAIAQKKLFDQDHMR
jgi:glycosyltransferase involved in cell wall biosynthesis